MPRPSQGGGVRDPAAKRQAVAQLVGVSAIAIVLSVPGFVFPYLYDDFDFLARTLHFRAGSLLPDLTVVFYRPVSRELYFAFLQWASPTGPWLGHAINLLAIAGSAILVTLIARTFLGSRGGAIAGVLFAAFGQVPILTAWVSGAQDAFAITLTLSALYLELRGKHLPALLATGLAILSKETAVAAVPAVALSPWLRARGRRRPIRRVADYVILGITWAAIHPGIHTLFQRGFLAGATDYVGYGNPAWLADFLRLSPLLLNISPPALGSSWPQGLSIVAALGVALALVVVWLDGDHEPTGSRGARGGRLSALGLLMFLGPVLLTGTMLRSISPYYLVFPSLGVVWLLAAALRRAPRALVLALCSAYVLGGVEARTIRVNPEIPTERNMALAASALRRLEPQFRSLAPSLPESCQVLIASQVRGSASVHVHLYRFQVLRQWYRNPTIRTMRPELREANGGREVLFWVNRDLNLYQIILPTLQPRSTAGDASLTEYLGTLRAYTRGLAESGEVNRAVAIQLSLPEQTTETRWVDRRLAASYLLAHGRRSDALALLAGAPGLPHEDAVAIAVELLAQPTAQAHYDEPTFEALGLDYGDPIDLRAVMGPLAATGNLAAPRLAQRLLAKFPNDAEAIVVLRKLGPKSSRERITSPQ